MASRDMQIWYREVWVTARKLCTVLNSKTPLTTWACACLAGMFFDLLAWTHIATFLLPALLLVAFAFGRPAFGVRTGSSRSKSKHRGAEHQIFGERTGPLFGKNTIDKPCIPESQSKTKKATCVAQKHKSIMLWPKCCAWETYKKTFRESLSRRVANF